jgi:hypothetical protein
MTTIDLSNIEIPDGHHTPLKSLRGPGDAAYDRLSLDHMRQLALKGGTVEQLRDFAIEIGYTPSQAVSYAASLMKVLEDLERKTAAMRATIARALADYRPGSGWIRHRPVIVDAAPHSGGKPSFWTQSEAGA